MGHGVTLADLAVWGALRQSAEFQKLLSTKLCPQNVTRYYRFLAIQPKFAVVDKAVPRTQAAAAAQPKGRFTFVIVVLAM